ncbi:MAG: hypothetical protein ACYDH5_09100 [Acidimicrobiales bacterium]
MARHGPDLITLASIGTMNVVAIGAGLGLGWVAYTKLHSVVFVFAGLLVGIALGAVGTYLEMRKYLSD